MRIYCLIMFFAFCGVSAKYTCKAPYQWMTRNDCKLLHGGIMKEGLVKSKEGFCCPPLETSITQAGTETKPTNATPLQLFPNDMCGKRPIFDRKILSDNGNKVHKGIETTDGEIPWIVHITSFGATNIPSFCGGTIINKNYVLTAAHCFVNGADRIEITLGTNDIYATEKCTGSLCLPIKRQGKNVSHENFHFSNRINDIALIRLTEPVEFNDFIQPACLPLAREIDYNTMERKNSMLTAGYGDENATTSLSGKLLSARQNLYWYRQCKKIYDKYLPYEVMDESHICTLGDKKSRAMTGDSGGPLLVPRNKDYVLIGVFSRGPRNFEHKRGLPVLYAKVEHYLDWIYSHVKE